MEIISLGEGLPDIKVIYINSNQAFIINNYNFVLIDIVVLTTFKEQMAHTR